MSYAACIGKGNVERTVGMDRVGIDDKWRLAAGKGGRNDDDGIDRIAGQGDRPDAIVLFRCGDGIV